MDFFHTHISKKSRQLVNEVLDTSFISAGKTAQKFEEALSKNLGLVNPVSVNSGTAALHLGLVAAGVKAGDEVIIPAQTFVATGLSVLMCGAVPVFADIQSTTGNISTESIAQKITPKTKAIIPVHWGGYPCDMDEINQLAKDHGLAVLEDAAHALGATYKNRPVGSLSRLTAFSFQAIKHLTTGDGGALCCLEEGDYKRAKNLRWFGIDRDNSQPSILGERVYNLTELGYKYHLNDYAAALGLGNLEDMPQILSRRREIAALYRQHLSNVPGLRLLNYKDDRQSSCWLFTVLAENREGFVAKLKEKAVPASVVHLRIDKYSLLGGQRKDLPEQDKFDKLQVSIPLHQGLSGEDVELVINTIKQGW